MFTILAVFHFLLHQTNLKGSIRRYVVQDTVFRSRRKLTAKIGFQILTTFERRGPYHYNINKQSYNNFNRQ